MKKKDGHFKHSQWLTSNIERKLANFTTRIAAIMVVHMKFDGPVESHQVYATVVRPLLGCSQLFVALFLSVVAD